MAVSSEPFAEGAGVDGGRPQQTEVSQPLGRARVTQKVYVSLSGIISQVPKHSISINKLGIWPDITSNTYVTYTADLSPLLTYLMPT